MTDIINTGSVEATQEEVGAGTSEHDQAMLEKVDQMEAGLQERPDWLPEKFSSPEQMAEAYKSLETKMSSGDAAPVQDESVEESDAAETESAPSADTTPNEVDELLESKGLEFDKFQTEYDNEGGISEASMAELEAAGLPKSLVDSWIKGQEALMNDYETAVYNVAGGQESYSELVQWAGDNLTQSEAAAFDKAVDSRDLDMVKLAVGGLQSRYQATEGSTPQLLQGDASQQSVGGAFNSVAEMSTAMRDPRYHTDASYRQQVAEKLSRSNILQSLFPPPSGGWVFCI